VRPLEHFLLAFIPVWVYVFLHGRGNPSLRLVAIVFVGSQFPDLVDKPLAHAFFLIPSGRVFMHSLPFAIPLVLLVGIYGWKTSRTRTAFAFNYAFLSHLVADHQQALIKSNPEIPPDLLWPFVTPVSRPMVPILGWSGVRWNSYLDYFLSGRSNLSTLFPVSRSKRTIRNVIVAPTSVSHITLDRIPMGRAARGLIGH